MIPRIGVFVCHCGTNIGGYVDVPDVVEYVKALPGVVHAERNIYTCADDGLTSIKNAIKSRDLNRVIVASCTPRTHAPLFRSAVAAAGLNPYLFELVNIREQCSWVHMKEKEAATQKAKDLIRMGVARVSLLEPQEEIRINVTPSALVIGGGVAGMTAALSIANQGFRVDLIEKESELGGMLRHLYTLYPDGRDASPVLAKFIENVKNNRNIEIHTSSRVKKVDGYIGNFTVWAENEKGPLEIRTGVLVVATGAEEFKPLGLYGYGAGAVLTELELEDRLRSGLLHTIKSAVFIQCAGARCSDRAYCSRICCNVAIKNAMILKQMFPEADINILHNGIRAYGTYEKMYRQAQELGVGFRKYSKEIPPEVMVNGERARVKFYHELMGKEIEYSPDLIVLSSPLVPHGDVEEISKMLKVPLGQDGFFLEAHVKLRPVDFATDGIFLCGTARAPADITESICQGYAAASRASIPLMKGYVQAEAITAVVDETKCIGCGYCASVCPYNAASMNEKTVAAEEFSYATKKSYINPALCKGCGTCAAGCPAGAITPNHFTLPQIIASIKAFQPERYTLAIA
ncbi:MAG: CoB--CoM heterodisulfide reductase iron-sulfur subunit A family protein [Candidatus Methanoperedens sp.]|nr:CoB--CoM heterodisulfide reductase iron-sulfur subunit A family protein [Candidatus Methanoperedens sp.]MCZ7359063.1 CoB--CoM heterodisulfide reductase iron-sulfur subunit A family protein [Candidatus Methanoperedens sp.]HLB70861.1 CoB--CoM heterodisulfide reductase iron-sulfur subunit A family protein [Candidatus Methanoperedens sp.]